MRRSPIKKASSSIFNESDIECEYLSETDEYDSDFVTDLSGLWGYGSPVVKVSDHDEHVMSSSPVPLKEPPCRGAVDSSNFLPKDEVEKLAYQLNEEAERTERPIRRLSEVMYGSTCADMQVDVMGECLSSIKHVVGEQLSGGSVVVVHEEPHPQMTGTLSYRPEETGGRQRRHRRHTTQATGRPISRFTVARRLHGGGLFARRPVRCVHLTPAHRRRRSLWCREHRNWRDREWGRVLFTVESRFSLSSDSHRILIWRERGSRNHPSNIIERDRYGGRGVLVWAGIMLGSRTDLHIFDAGSVNGTSYCNEILLPYVRLFRGAMGLQFLFMDDNAPCHRTVAAEQLLESEDIERMDWPARSPDLNPIEHVWDFLGRRLAARTLPPVTIRELRLALQDEWAAMPQQLIDILILSMGRRCETCLAVRGDHIPY
ncbi:transposable element Tcb2 transposase [Trichonephila clavipes]|nr:transposable element Tcb2 transposase [Trichonephila clavipes]